MKVLCLALLVIFSIIGIGTNAQTQEDFLRHARVQLAKGISQALVDRFVQQAEHGFLDGEQGTKIGILPNFTDPITLPSVEIPWNYDTEGLATDGHLSVCTPEIVGLSQVTDNLLKLSYSSVNGLQVEWGLDVPTAAIQGVYQLGMFLNATAIEPSELIVNGEGVLKAGIEKLFFELKVNATGLMDKLSVDGLWVDLGFDNITLLAEHLEFNGVEMSIEHIGSIIKTVFDLIWNEQSKPQINEMIRCSIDHFIGDCNIMDVMNLILYCLRVEPNPACFGEDGGEGSNVAFPSVVWGSFKQEPGYCEGLEVTTPSGTTSSDDATTTPSGTTSSDDATTTPSGTTSSDDATTTPSGTTSSDDATTTSSGTTSTPASSTPSGASTFMWKSTLSIFISLFLIASKTL